MSEENKPYIEAMRELRRSNAAQPHVNRQRRCKRGFGKGGRLRENELRRLP